jgi:hypothetical protein
MSNAWQGQSSVQDKLCSKQTQPLLQTDLICMCIRGPAKSQMTFDLQTILVQDQTFHLSNHAQEVTQLLALKYAHLTISVFGTKI